MFSALLENELYTVRFFIKDNVVPVALSVISVPNIVYDVIV